MEFAKIRDVCTFLPKSKIKAGEGLEEGLYYFFTSSDIKVLKINEYLFDDEVVILGTGGKPSCNYYNGKFSISTDNFVLKSSKINMKYLYYFLRNNNLSILDKGFRGAGLKHISKDYVCDIKIPIIALNDQAKIVEELDLLNNNIKLYNNQIQYLDDIVKSQFFEMSENKEKNTLFIDCVERMTKGPFGSAVKKELYVPESDDAYKVYIQINCIQKNELLGDYFISEDYFNSKMKSFEVKPNDYLITCDGTLGKYVRLSNNPRKGIISASLLRIQLREDVMLPEYFEVMWDEYLLDKLKGKVRNGCLTHLPSANVIGNEYIYLPSMSEQIIFSNYKKQIDKLKITVQKQIDLLEELLELKMNEYFGDRV